jgi:hypothetical protein
VRSAVSNAIVYEIQKNLAVFQNTFAFTDGIINNPKALKTFRHYSTF